MASASDRPDAGAGDGPGDATHDAGDARNQGRRGPRRPGQGRRGGFAGRHGDGFGFGPPPFGRRGRRRTSRGDVRLAILAVLAEQPRHGYEIIQQIGERTAWYWRPSPGSIYPTIGQLTTEGLVVADKEADGRRVIRLTEAGRRYVDEHREDLDRVWEAAGAGVDDATAELWEQLRQLNAAAMQATTAGTPEQIAAATTSISDARKAIYRLLAE
jgi:DNA-binding PadR family transcriptional regulator